MKIITNPLTLTIMLIIGQQQLLTIIDNQGLAFELKSHLTQTISLQPTEKKEGWSEWESWVNFPHNQIQLGLSNSDYGTMMDLEYKCFNQVGSVNDELKKTQYWYRISDLVEDSEYLKIEVICWQENQIKATAIVNGLIINK